MARRRSAASRPAFAQLAARRRKGAGEPAKPFGYNGLETQAQVLGQPCGGAAGADGDLHRIALENARGGEVAEVRPVHDIDQQACSAQARGCFLRLVRGDERQARPALYALVSIGNDFAPGAFDQAALGLGSRSLPQHDHRLTGDAVEERQALQSSHSGTRSAA